ncbi:MULTISPECIES: carbohydrate ABC transporter permease [Rhizobium]|uniref:carbohydrate ABC transporter permease n=1 Tax=Rhizobium TaxID=379 RepID=UPI000673C0F0|nr:MULTISPECIES: sugar ABC transporter permease [Rhizobium]ARM91917.1 sugar ABC transporter permease protein [Rhizobium sp. CIAT894]OHV19470.1 ABC transporter permease [Rhizobium sp. RSm-3]OWV66126.1 ABC transporter permease [Rhizobium sp. N122]RVU09781.1 sugar ABC transporter permease [Rhizobium sp. RMa-01]
MIIEQQSQATLVPVSANRVKLARTYRREWAFFVGPTFLFLIITGIFPLVASIYTGFFQTRRGEQHFVGFTHYKWALHDDVFWTSTLNSFIFTGGTVIGHLLIGLTFALLLNSAKSMQSFWRGLQFIPWLFPPAAVSILWILIYQDQFGLLNSLFRDIGLASWAFDWLGQPSSALAAVTIASIWNWYPFLTLILLAALQNVPDDLYEAMDVDGGSAWDKFRLVTLPHLAPVMLTACLLDFFWTFRFFDMTWIMTKGGPGRSSEVLATYLYKLAFQEYRFDRAAAVGGLILLMMAVLTGLYLVAYRYVENLSGRQRAAPHAS